MAEFMNFSNDPHSFYHSKQFFSLSHDIQHYDTV